MNDAALRSASTETRVAWLSEAAGRLQREAENTSEALAASTGLSVRMVSWGLRTTLQTIAPEALQELARQARSAGGKPISSLSIVLAGNVFTAAVRAVFVPLLLGIPVTVKASSRETLFPTMLVEALRSSDPALGAAVHLVTFAGGDIDHETVLIENAEVTAVYGADRTVQAIRRRHPNARLIAHGHGVSVAYCGPEALERPNVPRTIANLAIDVAAYDQRGCLSPQIIYVATDSERSLSAFARRFASEGLSPLTRELPRGALPPEMGAVQAQWRGVAEVEGSLIAGDAYAIAVRPPESVRWSPGYRNVTLSAVRDLAEAIGAMEPLADSLKCVGVDPSSASRLDEALGRNETLTAYVCPIGTMQTPPLDAPADGKPVWDGLLR